jgi:preprotein translocase subunit YajC
MRLIQTTLAALVLAASPMPALAQAAPAVGMQVVDSAGAPVGTVTAIKGDNLQVKTDKHEALLPKSSFTLNKGKLLFGMTQAQLDSTIEASTAAAQASIVAGATVNGAAGTAIGKIESVEDGKVTIALSSGKKIQVPSTALRGNADGTVTIGYTAEQIDALVNAPPAADSTSK